MWRWRCRVAVTPPRWGNGSRALPDHPAWCCATARSRTSGRRRKRGGMGRWHLLIDGVDPFADPVRRLYRGDFSMSADVPTDHHAS